MKISGMGKPLADEFGPHRLAALIFDQAAVGLFRKEELGQAGHQERIGHSGEDQGKNGSPVSDAESS
jgi:hypothetical protein